MADAGAKTGTGRGAKSGGRGPGAGSPVLLTLDGRAHGLDEPLLCADDLAVLRGDGVFETLLVRGGRPCLLGDHLDRLERSAATLELPRPDRTAWERVAADAAELWGSDREASMRLVLTRGREGTATPTAFVMVTAVTSDRARAREDGVAVITLDSVRSIDTAETSPWALAGAKTLSYAENMAALRYAKRSGADDVIFVSAEGYVLEGPRSTVVAARGGALVTPPVEHSILAGTTQHALFRAARGKGIECTYAPLRPADLIAADGVWLLSSVTLVAAVHTINGVEIGRSDRDRDLRAMVDAAVGADKADGGATEKGSAASS